MEYVGEERERDREREWVNEEKEREGGRNWT